MSRPVTSKPRGVCRYYNVPRGCFAGDKCKFLHAVPSLDPKPDDPPLLTPYDKAKRCRYYAQGYCKRGEACWFLHVADPSPAAAPPDDEEDEEACSFVLRNRPPMLCGCSHIFCTSCIKQWRDPQNKQGDMLVSGNTKKCPMCRTPSKFITPSSRFWKDGTPEKAAVMQAYMDSMARVPCRYFQKSLQKNKDKPLCPYGKDCFYQHLKEDGTPHVFKDGVDVCMSRYRQSHYQRRGFVDMQFMPLSLSDLDFMLPVVGRSVRENGSQSGRNATLRRLQEMGRSLDLLSEAISELPSLSDLDFAETRGQRTYRGRVRDDAARREEGYRDLMSTDEMLAALGSSYRPQATREEGQRTGTPPPPLEAVGAPAGYDSESSMPRLESTSATEDEEDGNWSDEPSDEEDLELQALARMGLIDFLAGQRESPAEEELPALEPIDGGSDGEEESEDGPFVTDGRGRAVWTGPGEEDKRDRSGEGDGDGGGDGRSILGWFSGLF
ncbi:hypothetical protein CPB84DRAFT_1843201 [Gymnopilus junonius]|uniref:RING-type E3 ubiquitin transferase n=1 Tax=Gymnopilus junonius TaxID=109634 RepID=A0A9P5TSI3_GYMJU|nr:hypothetical protein CPB84DRAFT_1843201 [Gymnopilus junonius]